MFYLSAKRHRSIIWWEDALWKTFWATIERIDYLIWFLVEYQPITAKDQSRIHLFGKKVLPGLFLKYALYAGWIWKGDVLIADLEELETMDASEILLEKTQCERSDVTHKKKENLFPNRRWTNQNPWRRPGFENFQFGTASPTLRREWYWLEESEGSLPPLQDSFPDAGEAMNDFWIHVRKLHMPPSCWTQSQASLAERRIIPYSN